LVDDNQLFHIFSIFREKFCLAGGYLPELTGMILGNDREHAAMVEGCLRSEGFVLSQDVRDDSVPATVKRENCR